MTPTRKDPMAPALDRDEAESLFAQLRERAGTKRHRRARVRRAAGVGATLIVLTVAIVVRSALIQAPPAAAFSSCRPVSSPGGVLGLLVRAPGIALLEQAGSATIHPQSVTVRCALQGSMLVAVRVSSVVAPYGEVSVETWFRAPAIGSSSPGARVDIGTHAVRALALDGGGFAVAPSGYPGIALVILRGPNLARVMNLGVKLGIATRTSTDLASGYELGLSEPPAITPHPASPSSSWHFDVSSQEDLVARLGALGLPLVAVLPDAQPQRVDVFQGDMGLIVKTTYPDAAPGGVRVVQSENAQVEPVGGTAVQVHGVAGLQVGSTVYWQEEGYLLAVDVDPGDPLEYANLVTWTAS